MTSVTRTLTALSDDVNGIAEAQTLGGAGNVALDGVLVTGGVAIIAEAQIVTITSVGNDAGITFTFTGTDPDGKSITEVVTGPNATTAVTTKFFKTITQVAVSGATADDITLGPLEANGAVSRTIPANWRESNFKVSLVVVVPTGTLTYSVQHTVDDIQDATVEPTWLNNDDLAAKSATEDGNLNFPVRGVRLILTAFTSGSATLTYTQAL